MLRPRSTVLATLFALSFLACTGSARIKDILERPADFEGRSVTLAGTVVEAANILVLRYYKVDDGTGQLVVITKKAVPAKGASVTARGIVHQAFALGDESLTVLVESEE